MFDALPLYSRPRVRFRFSARIRAGFLQRINETERERARALSSACRWSLSMTEISAHERARGRAAGAAAARPAIEDDGRRVTERSALRYTRAALQSQMKGCHSFFLPLCSYARLPQLPALDDPSSALIFQLSLESFVSRWYLTNYDNLVANSATTLANGK